MMNDDGRSQLAAVLSPPSFREINYFTIHIFHGILFFFVKKRVVTIMTGIGLQIP